ncbi:MAG TPA: TetR/AcrR family transcriptional regulator [Solirubrobacteraceae bacterium]|jgi:AcrR family transcriptional regulator|nr:TetR/AcrR family transcriptional regulator [Solirubrobacteraceae bacterium]
MSDPAPRRRTQAERRAQTRAALLAAAARGLSRYGYGPLTLEQVASDAGYTRGALYHQFAGKEELALAVVRWVASTWEQEVWEPAQLQADPVGILVALARGHVAYCRRDVARVIMALRVEFAGREHPVGSTIDRIITGNARRFAALITAARARGAVPPGPPAQLLAMATIAALEGLAIQVAGAEPDDEVLAERLMRGLLGCVSAP